MSAQGNIHHDYFDIAERSIERAEQWKTSEEDPLRVGRVEQWKLITPRDRPHEPVWLIEARDRDGVLWSKFVSETALQVKLLGRKLENEDEIRAADPSSFPATVGSFVAVKFEGRHPHSDEPGKTVTRWNVSIVKPEPETDESRTPENVDGDIPF